MYVYLLLSLLPLRALCVLVLHGGIGDGAAAVSGARVGISLRELALDFRRVRVRVGVLAGEDGEPDGPIDERGVGGEGEFSGSGGEGGQRIGFRIVARRFSGVLRRVEELDGLRRRKLEERGEGIGGFRRWSHDALKFLVELNRVERGLFHDPIEPDRTGESE